MADSERPPKPSPPPETTLRWPAVFQRSTEPIFLLNRRRQILFVNKAWEALTRCALADVKGHVCRRRPRGILADPLERLLSDLAPPPEVVRGGTGQTLRLRPGGDWRIAFFPLADADGTLAILGKIQVTPRRPEGSRPPLSEKVLAVRQRRMQQFQLDQLVTLEPALERVIAQVRLASPLRAPVLLVGEPGTGKHWLARTIHEASGRRDGDALARLDCARLPAEAVADVVFAGADAAPGLVNAVYLENLDAWPRELQERLDLLLQEETAQPRIFAALVTDPRELLSAGKLHAALYCRLSALTIHVPALRERRADLPWWVERLLDRARAATETSVKALSTEALACLSAYDWPGNLTELYETLCAACLRAKKDVLDAGDLPFHLRHGPLPPDKNFPLDDILAKVEQRLIVQALRLAKNNKSRAAELLAIWRPRLLRRMEALGIKDDKAEADASDDGAESAGAS